MITVGVFSYINIYMKYCNFIVDDSVLYRVFNILFNNNK